MAEMLLTMTRGHGGCSKPLLLHTLSGISAVGSGRAALASAYFPFRRA